MKRYFYHIVYELRTPETLFFGSYEARVDGPIENEETVHAIAALIKAERKLPRRPIITNFLLLRTEESPE